MHGHMDVCQATDSGTKKKPPVLCVCTFCILGTHKWRNIRTPNSRVYIKIHTHTYKECTVSGKVEITIFGRGEALPKPFCGMYMLPRKRTAAMSSSKLLKRLFKKRLSKTNNLVSMKASVQSAMSKTQVDQCTWYTIELVPRVGFDIMGGTFPKYGMCIICFETRNFGSAELRRLIGSYAKIFGPLGVLFFPTEINPCA